MFGFLKFLQRSLEISTSAIPARNIGQYPNQINKQINLKGKTNVEYKLTQEFVLLPGSSKFAFAKNFGIYYRQ